MKEYLEAPAATYHGRGQAIGSDGLWIDIAFRYSLLCTSSHMSVEMPRGCSPLPLMEDDRKVFCSDQDLGIADVDTSLGRNQRNTSPGDGRRRRDDERQIVSRLL